MPYQLVDGYFGIPFKFPALCADDSTAAMLGQRRGPSVLG